MKEKLAREESTQNVTLRFWLSPPHPEAQTTGCSDKVCVVREGTPRVAEEGETGEEGSQKSPQPVPVSPSC